MNTDHGRVLTDRAGGADAPEPRAASQPAGAHPSRGEIWQHLKRGTTYEIVGCAELQMTFDLLCDGSEMIVYRGKDGKLWAREKGEFTDGRFERVAIAAPNSDDLTQWGWAPGSYVFRCIDCPDDIDFYEKMGRLGDKRSIRCEEHAIAARDSHASLAEDAQRLSPEGVAARAEGSAR